MANISHKNLSGTQLHENKGVAAASDNTVATAVSGATVWAKLTASNLTGTGNSFGGQLVHVRSIKTLGTASGTSVGSAAWTTLPLTDLIVNDLSASIASSGVSLAAGTYWCMGHLASCQADGGGVRLRGYNLTDGASLFDSMPDQISNSGVSTRLLPIYGRFTLSGTKTVVFQMYRAGGGTLTWGRENSTVTNEVYADVMFWKTA